MKKKVYLLAAISIFCWSTVATVTKQLLNNINSLQLLWSSSLLAAVFLLIINITSGNIKKLKEYKAKDYLVTLMIGFPGTFLYYMFYYAGASMMPASQAFIVNYLWPIMSVVAACLILKEKMTLRKGIAIAVSFIGVGIVTGGSLMEFNKNTVIGAPLCILGAVSYGVFTALNQKVKYEKRVSMMIYYFETFVLTGIINIVTGNIFLPDFGQLLRITWNGVFSMAVANTCWMFALQGGNTAKISNLAYITPFLSLVWTFLILKEDITFNSVIGLIVIVLGIFIQMKKTKNIIIGQ